MTTNSTVLDRTAGRLATMHAKDDDSTARKVREVTAYVATVGGSERTALQELSAAVVAELTSQRRNPRGWSLASLQRLARIGRIVEDHALTLDGLTVQALNSLMETGGSISDVVAALPALPVTERGEYVVAAAAADSDRRRTVAREAATERHAAAMSEGESAPAAGEGAAAVVAAPMTVAAALESIRATVATVTADTGWTDAEWDTFADGLALTLAPFATVSA